MRGLALATALAPVTKTNWESTGVEPDVKAPSADALEKAQELLRANAQPPGPRPGA